MTMREGLRQVFDSIQQQPVRQDGTVDQLRDLRDFANRLGMYDAADFLRNVIERPQDQLGRPMLRETTESNHDSE